MAAVAVASTRQTREGQAPTTVTEPAVAAGVGGGEGLQGEGPTRRWPCGCKGVWEAVRSGCALCVLPVNAGCRRSAAGEAVPVAPLRRPGNGGNR